MQEVMLRDILHPFSLVAKNASLQQSREMFCILQRCGSSRSAIEKFMELYTDKTGTVTSIIIHYGESKFTNA